MIKKKEFWIIFKMKLTLTNSLWNLNFRGLELPTLFPKDFRKKAAHAGYPPP